MNKFFNYILKYNDVLMSLSTSLTICAYHGILYKKIKKAPEGAF